jgi:hypothetical protein
MAQVVEALRYKPGNCGFDSRWGNPLNPSGRTMAVESIQPLIKWEPEVSPGECKQPVRRADNLTTFICRLSSNSGTIYLLETSGAVQTYGGIALPSPSNSSGSICCYRLF